MTTNVQATQEMHLKNWQDEVNSLCHEVFFNTDAGKKLLFLWEQRYFYAPVASPHQSIDFARFNEGRNDHIRSIRAAAYAAMKHKEPTELKVETDENG